MIFLPIRRANFCGPLLRSTFAVHFCGQLLRSTFAVNFCGPSKVTNVGTSKRPGRHGHFWFRTISLTFGNFGHFAGLYLKFWESVKKCACTHHPPQRGFEMAQTRKLRKGPEGQTGVSGICARFLKTRKRPTKCGKNHKVWFLGKLK